MYFSLTKSMILFSLSLWSFQSFGQEKVINVLETNEPPAEIPIGSDGKEVFSIVDEPADFPGGPEAMRKYLSDMNPVEAMDFINDRFKKTRNNEEFLIYMND